MRSRGSGGSEQLLHLFRRERPGQEESLAELTLFRLKLGELRYLFDALGQGLEVEGLAELHEGVDEGVSFG